MGMPVWVRILLRVDRALHRAVQLESAVRDELLWAWLPASGRQQLTDEIYSSQRGYLPGGAAFERGLREWEERLFGRSELARAGRVLIGGAGAGRELRALAARGYQVTAFEPCETLARVARKVASPFADARVLEGAYEDLVRATRGEGPLAALRDDAPFAWVLLGWSSLSHVVDREERDRLFGALATLAPGAPVAASFVPRRSTPGGARRLLRRAFAFARAPSAAPDGALFLPRAGFCVELDRDDLARSARAGGYRIAAFDTEPDGHVLLVPDDRIGA